MFAPTPKQDYLTWVGKPIETSAQNKMKKEKIIEVIWLVLAVLLFVVSIYFTKSGELASSISSLGILAPIIIIILKISTLVIAPLGGLPLYIIAGGLFGGFYGFLICFFADVLGCSICFLLSRKYGVKVLNLFVGTEKVEKITKVIGVIRNWKALLKIRSAFIYSPEFFSYGAGITPIRFSEFTIINSIFLIPVDILSVFFGSKISELSTKYTLFFSLTLFILIAFGLLSIYKDYKKSEGM